jgi:hypothetical protein
MPALPQCTFPDLGLERRVGIQGEGNASVLVQPRVLLVSIKDLNCTSKNAQALQYPRQELGFNSERRCTMYYFVRKRHQCVLPSHLGPWWQNR